MLNTIITKSRYDTTTYPNLQTDAEGVPIPIGIGDIHSITPTCIDIAAQKYKILGHAIHALSAVRAGAETLVLGTDYTEDLANAEFTIEGTPIVEANKTYYFLLESDIVIDGSNYYHLERNLGDYYDLGHNVLTNGDLYDINAADDWTDTTYGLYYEIYGKTDLTGNEECFVAFYDNKYLHKSGNWTWHPFRDNVARTKLAQSFATPTTGGPWYVTKVKVGIGVVGAPASTRITTISILDSTKAQVGCKSYRYEDAQGDGRFPIRAEVSSLECDIEGAEKTGAMIDTVADFMEYLVGTILGKAASLLDSTYLSDLATDRTQKIKVYLDQDDLTVGQVIGKLEAGQLWKLIPLLDGTYATVVYESGEPANTPHFRDEDYLSFRMWRDYDSVRQIVKVKYDENPQKTEFKAKTIASDIARFFYRNEETLEVETYLAEAAGAAWLAGALGPMYEQPPLMCEFEVHGYGLDLIPGRDKVKLTRTRAMYTGGALDAVLFRILKLQKRPGTSTTVITCQLDTQTY